MKITKFQYKKFPMLHTIKKALTCSQCFVYCVYQYVCTLEEMVLADVWEGQGLADWLIHPDGAHPNKVRNLIIAKAWESGSMATGREKS